MTKITHPLHVAIGELFDSILSGFTTTCKLVKEEASGEQQRIPLFISEKGRENWYCDVDLLVLKNNKIKILVEIEETDLGPTQVCGKYLTSALARYYIHKKTNNKPIEMDNSVTFIQIIDSKKLNQEKTKKFDQWKNLENSIKDITPVTNSNIKKYRLFYGTTLDFKKKYYYQRMKLVNLIKNICSENKLRSHG